MATATRITTPKEPRRTSTAPAKHSSSTAPKPSYPAPKPWKPPPPKPPFVFAKGTPEEVKVPLKASPFPGEVPTGGKPWIEKAKGLPENTLQTYRREGRLDPERKRLWDAIIESRLSAVEPTPADKKPVAVLMMGLTASGKSSIAKGIVGDGSDFVMVDPDALKDDLPEYKQALDQHARNAAFLVHHESAELASRLKKEAVKSRRSLVVDGTGRDGPAYAETVRHLKKAGYDIHLFMAACDTEKAVTRAKERAEQTGRWVPPGLIRQMPEEVHPNFLWIAGLVDNAALYNTNDFPPKKLWTKTAGTETIHDAEDYKTFQADAKDVEEGLTIAISRMYSILMEDDAKPTEPAMDPEAVQDRAWGALQQKEPKGTARFKAGEGLKMPEPGDGALG
jgi:predicted ABC-type ATPase